MNKAILGGRITSDIKTFGTESNPGVSFTLVTWKPVIRDGVVQKDANGYTETYDEFHTIKAFGGLARAVAKHKKKGDKLSLVGEIRYSKNEHEGRTYYNTEIKAEDIDF